MNKKNKYCLSNTIGSSQFSFREANALPYIHNSQWCSKYCNFNKITKFIRLSLFLHYCGHHFDCMDTNDIMYSCHHDGEEKLEADVCSGSDKVKWQGVRHVTIWSMHNSHHYIYIMTKHLNKVLMIHPNQVWHHFDKMISMSMLRIHPLRQSMESDFADSWILQAPFVAKLPINKPLR